MKRDKVVYSAGMKVGIVLPRRPGVCTGNRVTALRWAQCLRSLGHRVRLRTAYEGEPFDALVALHARRSYRSIEHFARRYPDRPLIVALTGTDLYGDLDSSAEARHALELAWRLIVLQERAARDVPARVRPKVCMIPQSAVRQDGPVRRRSDVFEVAVLAHLREVKDPFCAAEAASLLPASSRVRIVHAGAALSEAMADRARRAQASSPRYEWLGALPRGEALQLLARSRLLAVTSRMEGGANVVSEAIVHGVPVVSSRIAGSIGLLGADYPGYFPAGDRAALAALIHRAETDEAFYRALCACGEAIRHVFDPARERERWARLLADVGTVEHEL